MKNYLKMITDVAPKYKRIGYVKQIMLSKPGIKPGEAQYCVLRFIKDELPLSNEYIAQKLTAHNWS